ncbi:MAG TPA: sugar phosphate isomerase/epimerase, partial [Opitutaceae bacterium]|nr:sugar phosphate isomerase/epimerase [Opitutaceae bacterium]
MTTSSRRTFLKVASSAVAAAALPSWVPAAGPKPQRSGISLGHSLYGMQTVPLTEAVAHCARLGFKNVELMVDPGAPADPRTFSKAARQALRSQLKSEGLTVSALMRNLRLIEGTMTSAQNVEALKEAAQLAHDLSPDAPPPIETVMGGKPDQWEASKATMAGALAEWTATVESAQVDLLLKAHVFMAVNTPEKLLWLLDQKPSSRVHVTYDYSHFQPQDLSMEST